MGDSHAGIVAHAGFWSFGLRSIGHIKSEKTRTKF